MARIAASLIVGKRWPVVEVAAAELSPARFS
jgi:hypothetical protein